MRRIEAAKIARNMRQRMIDMAFMDLDFQSANVNNNANPVRRAESQ
jgi:hypothetical protein